MNLFLSLVTTFIVTSITIVLFVLVPKIAILMKTYPEYVLYIGSFGFLWAIIYVGLFKE